MTLPETLFVLSPPVKENTLICEINKWYFFSVRLISKRININVHSFLRYQCN